MAIDLQWKECEGNFFVDLSKDYYAGLFAELDITLRLLQFMNLHCLHPCQYYWQDKTKKIVLTVINL